MICESDQLFYLEDLIGWFKASDLRVGDCIINAKGGYTIVQAIEPINESNLVYDITVKDHHNFYVTRSEVLVHNMLVLAAPAVATTVVAVAIETAATIILAAGCIYSFCWGIGSQKKKLSHGSGGGGNNRCFCGHYCGNACSCGCACGCGKSKQSVDGYAYEFGKYQDAGYHHANSKGNSKNGKSSSPRDGQKALDNSIPRMGNSTGRIGVSEGQIVVLSKTSEGFFHGHIITLEELMKEKKLQGIFKRMIQAGLLNEKGEILK